MHSIVLNWKGPFSLFADQTDPYYGLAHAVRASGVYLWGVPTVAGLKVAYIGKAGGTDTATNLRKRLQKEVGETVSGGCQDLLDLQLWRSALRRILAKKKSYCPIEHREVLDGICRTCRVYVAEVNAPKAEIELAERSLIRRLWPAYEDGPEYSRFLCNEWPRQRDESVSLVVHSIGNGILGLPDGSCFDQFGGCTAPGAAEFLDRDVEDPALINAIRLGLKSGNVDRGKVMRILVDAVSPLLDDPDSTAS